MGTLTSALRAPVKKNKVWNYSATCLVSEKKPHVDWTTSILFDNTEGVHHKFYPNTVDQLMKDHIILSITETHAK